MGAAKDSKTCESIVFNQVSSVGKIAMTVATLGGSMLATGPANAAEKTGRLAQLKAKYAELKAAYEAAKKTTPALQKAEEASAAKKETKPDITLTDATTAEDVARAAAQTAAIVDSSGVSSTVGAYTYPKCSEYLKAHPQ
jgi:hypothetical protein